VVFTDRNANGLLDITGTASTSDVLQENHYYAFGLGFEGPWLQNDAASRDNKYQFNGKELHDDFGFNCYAYGARYYDPVLARFTGVDPIADQFPFVTTFNYAENEPIANIDLHGLQKHRGVTNYNYKPLETKKQEEQKLVKINADNKGNISQASWGETQGVYPTKNTTNPTAKERYDPSNWDASKTKDLLEARANIDFIAENRNDHLRKDNPDLNDPLIKELASSHLKDNFPEVAPEIKDNKDVKFFFLSADKDAKHTGIGPGWDQKIVKSYGPFYNIGGGDVPKGAMYINFYSATPK
jgi:RHS repeat-associated protein